MAVCNTWPKQTHIFRISCRHDRERKIYQSDLISRFSFQVSIVSLFQLSSRNTRPLRIRWNKMELPLPLALPSLSSANTSHANENRILELSALACFVSFFLSLARFRYLWVCVQVFMVAGFFTVHMFLLSYVKSPFIVNPRQSTDKQKTYEPQIRERIYGISHSKRIRRDQQTHPHMQTHKTHMEIYTYSSRPVLLLPLRK